VNKKASLIGGALIILLAGTITVSANTSLRDNISDLFVPKGSLKVVTDSPAQQVQISIDSEPKGTTPLEINRITTGKHVLKVTSDGYKESFQEFTIDAKKLRTITVTVGENQQPYTEQGQTVRLVLTPAVPVASAVSTTVATSFAVATPTKKVSPVTLQLLKTSGEQLRLEYKKALDGTLALTENLDAVKAFRKDREVEGENLFLSIAVYQYKPGATYKESYEGEEWQRNLDKDIQLFKNLKSGFQKSDMYYMGYGDTSVMGRQDGGFDVELKKIGKVNFALFTTAFGPAGTKALRYFTFHEPTQQIIEIGLGYYPNNTSEKQLSQVKSELESILADN